MKAPTLAPSHPSRLRMYSMYYKIFPRVWEDAADGLSELVTHDLHQSLIELLERPEILRLHPVCRAGGERQLHLKIRALCGQVKRVFKVLVDTGAQVSLVKAGLLPSERLTTSQMYSSAQDSA